MKKLIPLKELAKRAGVNLSTVYRWVNLECPPKAYMALKLQEITGIKSYAWLFPDRYKNPYIDAYQAKRNKHSDKDVAP